MNILALDTCFPACSVAVSTEAGRVLGDWRAMETGQAEALVPMMAAQLKAAGLEPSDLDAVITTVGPGSFTGARIGVAAARALSLAVPDATCCGVSSLRLIAADALAADRRQERLPSSRLAVAAMDARRDEIYFQVIAEDGQLVTEPRLVSLADAATLLCAIAENHAIDELVGAGSAFEGLQARTAATGLSLRRPVDAKDLPDARTALPIAAQILAEALPAKPLYLRPPDAKPQAAATLERAVT